MIEMSGSGRLVVVGESAAHEILTLGVSFEKARESFFQFEATRSFHASFARHGVASLEFFAPHSVAQRRLFKGLRVECLRYQAKRKGRPGWKSLPRRLQMPGPIRWTMSFSPAEVP